MNRACLVAGMTGLALFGTPGSASSQSARVTLRVRPALMRSTPATDHHAETGPAEHQRLRRNAVMVGALVLTETARHGLAQHMERQLLALKPPILSRLGVAVSQESILRRFQSRRAIESLSPRLRDAARTFRFTLRVSF